MKNILANSGYLSLLVACAAIAAPTAHAEGGNTIGRINVVGDLNYNVYSESFSSNSINYKGSGSLGYGGGLLGDFGLADMIGLETGAIYFVRKRNIDLASGNSSNLVFSFGDMNVLHIPVDLVFGLNSAVSFIAGVFDEIPVNSHSGDNNLGVGGGLRFSIPVGAGTSFIIDGRFNHGLTQQSGFHTNDIHALLGLSFGGI